MIELTRLNGTPIVLNSDLIKTAEASPDTMLTLINGEKLIVREECSEVVERVLAYRARLLAAVARRLSSAGELQRVVSLASLDLSGQPGPGQAVPTDRDWPGRPPAAARRLSSTAGPPPPAIALCRPAPVPPPRCIPRAQSAFHR